MACPFMAAAAAGAGSDADSEVLKCPMMQQILEAHQRAGHLPAEGQGQTPAVCPLGFGSAGGPKLTKLHCPICKGILFDAHMTASCKHSFCHACISRTADCPVCGMDVGGLEPNMELAGLVDTFLDTHSKSPQLVSAQADLGPLPDNSAASFFMAQGLKSLAGGNMHAALHRFGRCRDALIAETAAGNAAAVATDGSAVDDSMPGEAGRATAAAAAVDSGATAADDREASTYAAAGPLTTGPCSTYSCPSPQQAVTAATAAPAPAVVMKACQMATACGLLADCYQRLSDSDQAEQFYLESLSSVKPYAEQDAEAAHAMSVTLNKLGDLRYSHQQLPAAKHLYKQALELRQMVCGPLTGGQAGPEQQLELVCSLIKMADVTQASGDHADAEQLLHRAAGVCFEVKLQEKDLSAATLGKLQLLLNVLHAQGSAAAC